MSKQLIFFGGSKGVGKSSLAKAVSSRLDFEYINTGERFRKYRPHFDKRFIQELIESDGSFIIDTHYAVSSSKTPYEFQMGIDKKYQMHLRFSTTYSGRIILIKTSPQIVLERRRKDGEERRCLELGQVIKENNFNLAYSRIYASCLNMPYHLLKNEGLSIEDAVSKLTEIIENE